MFGLTRNKFTKIGEEINHDELGDYHRVHIRHDDTGATFQITQRGNSYHAKDDTSGATSSHMDEGGLLGFIAMYIKGRRR